MPVLTFKKTKNPKMFRVDGENPVVTHLLQGKTVIGTDKDAKTVKQMYIDQQLALNPITNPKGTPDGIA